MAYDKSTQATQKKAYEEAEAYEQQRADVASVAAQVQGTGLSKGAYSVHRWPGARRLLKRFQIENNSESERKAREAVAYAPGISKEQAMARVSQVARQVAYDKGAAMTYTQVAERCDGRWPARLIAEGCELAGFPVWSSAPDEAMMPR